MLRGVGHEVGATDRKQLLLEGVRLRHTRLLRLSWGEVRLRTLLGPGHGLLVDGLDGCGPVVQLLIVRILLFELIPIAQEMHPTALMQALMAVVAGIEVTAKHPAVVLTDQLFDHFPATRMMVLLLADAGRAGTPDVAIEAVFAPPRLIGLHRRTGTDLPFERSEVRLHLVFEPVQQLHDLSNADPLPVQGEQVRLDLSNWRTHPRAKRWRSDWSVARRSVLALPPGRGNPPELHTSGGALRTSPCRSDVM